MNSPSGAIPGTGTLRGIKVIEFAGLGPGPFAGMLLSDMGAEVIRIDRPNPVRTTLRQRRDQEPMLRNRRSLIVDLKSESGRGIVLDLIAAADVVIEGFRPGVAEKLGIGPDACRARNPRLVYGRMTGWGQDGPLAQSAGHDINYIGLTGALHGIGLKDERPVPPMVLAGDTGGGGVFLALGICAALVERAQSGTGQVVDASIVDGSAALMSPIFGAHAAGVWTDERGSNRLDGGASYYRTYECSDGKYLAVGAIEEQFFTTLVELSGAENESFADRLDPANWADDSEYLEKLFLQRSRDEWCNLFEGTDACVTPVLSLSEAPDHPHNQQRELFVDMGGTRVPAPAPRFDRTPSSITRIPVEPGTDTTSILRDFGYSGEQIDAFLNSAVVTQTESAGAGH